MSSAYITCQVRPGLFDNEYYVMVNGSSAYYIHKKKRRCLSAADRGTVR